MNFTKTLHENRKVQFAVVASIAALLFVLGWRLEAKNLESAVPLETNTVSAIQGEVDSVKLAREDYLHIIGKDDGGAYDEYQDSLLCEENLEARLEEMKALRANYQRLISEVELKERESRIAKVLSKFEEKAIDKVAAVISSRELEALQTRKIAAQAEFEKSGSDLQSCIETFQDLEKCEDATQAFLKERDDFLNEIYEIESIVKEKRAEAEKQLEKMKIEAEREWYSSEQKGDNPKTSVLLNKIQAGNLQAHIEGTANKTVHHASSLLGVTGTGDQAYLNSILNNINARGDGGNTTNTNLDDTYSQFLTDNPINNSYSYGGVSTSDFINAGGTSGGFTGAVTGVVNGIFSPLTGLASGANKIIKSVVGGINGVSNALLGQNAITGGNGATNTNSGGAFGGPGAIGGLKVFRANYAGNTYGSAIGTITGWTNFALPFVGVVAIAAIIYAGFLYLTAAGNEEQTGKAKKIIIWVVIGIIVIFSAYAIVNTLLEGNEGGGGGGTSVGVNLGGINLQYGN